MKFVYGSKMKLAFIVSLIAVSFNAERAAAIEFVNDAGLISALKKNRMLSEKDLTAISSEYPKLEVWGNFQFQYLYAADSGANKQNEFDLLHANLMLVGRVTDKVSMFIEPEFGQGVPSIRDAYIVYKPYGFGIYAGNHRVPFSAEAMQNDVNLRFAERNLGSLISPDRMMGISVAKNMFNEKAMVQVGIWNSRINSNAEVDLINNRLADSQIFSSGSSGTGNNIFIRAFRIGSLSQGQSGFYSRGNGFSESENFNKETNFDWGVSFFDSASATTGNVSPAVTALNGVNAYEADLSFGFRSISAEIEYAERTIDWWQYNPFAVSTPVSSVQNSFSAQASALLTENLSFALRLDSFVYDGKGKVLKGALGQDQDNWTTVGVNYYLKEHNTKVQLNYTLKKESMPTGMASPKNDTMLIQATTYF